MAKQEGPNINYEKLFELSTAIFVVLDQQGRIVNVNQQAAKFLGFNKDELVGKDWFKTFVPKNIQQQTKASFKLILQGSLGLMEHHENVITTKQGEKNVSWYNSLIKDNQNLAIYSVSFGHDITEKIEIENKLIETTQTNQAIFDASPIAISALNNDYKITLWNAAAEKIFGWSSDEVMNKITPGVPTPLLAAAKKNWGKVLAGELDYYETTRQKKDGTLFDVKIYTAPTKDAKGSVSGFLAMIVDVTQSKQQEEMLFKFRLGIDRSSDIIFLTDAVGKIIYVNSAFSNVYGYSAQEALGKNPKIIKSGQQSSDFYRNFWQTLVSRKIYSGEIINKTKAGLLVTAEISVSPIIDKNNGLIGFLAIQRDVNIKKQTEISLKRALSLNQKIIDKSPLGIFIIDQDGKVEYINQALSDISGGPTSNFIGMDILSHPGYKQIGLDKKIKESMLSGKDFVTEIVKYKSRMGKKETFRIFSGTPIMGDNGKMYKFILSVKDVTALQKNNEELEAFNNLMVGRELKMVELKDQVAALKLELDGTQTATLGKTAISWQKKFRQLITSEEKIIQSFGTCLNNVEGANLGYFKTNKVREIIKILINESEYDKKLLLDLISRENEKQKQSD